MKNQIPNHYNQIPCVKRYGPDLGRLCRYIYNNAHPEAEKTFVSIAEKLFNDSAKYPEKKQGLTAICDILYSEFNDYYIAWATEQGLNPPQPSTICHFFNFFLENSTTGEKLEDVIWELSSYIINSPSTDNIKNIKEKISMAKKSIKN